MSADCVATSVWEPNRLVTMAKGARIWLNGVPCLDFACGPGVFNVGHNNPEIWNAIHQVYARDEAGCGGNMILNKYQLELAAKLCQLTPGKFSKKVFFSNSGGEAVEAAVQACMRRRPERRGMLSFIGDFHGRLGFGRTATTSKPLHIEGLPWGIEKALFLIFPADNPETPTKKEFLQNISTPAKYLNYAENTIGPFLGEINFAIFELIQGEGGINMANRETIRVLCEYLRDNNIPIIVDEVQSGLGRTGKMWSADYYGIDPDIVTIAKALSGGVIPIGATVMREELSYQKIGEHCNTFGGGALACAAGLKVLEIIERDGLAEKASAMGLTFFKTSLATTLTTDYPEAARVVAGVSGVGLMSRVTFRNPEIRKAVMAEALGQGLFLMAAGERSVRLMPPLTITEEEMREALQILVRSIKNVSQCPR